MLGVLREWSFVSFVQSIAQFRLFLWAQQLCLASTVPKAGSPWPPTSSPSAVSCFGVFSHVSSAEVGTSQGEPASPLTASWNNGKSLWVATFIWGVSALGKCTYQVCLPSALTKCTYQVHLLSALTRCTYLCDPYRQEISSIINFCWYESGTSMPTTCN